MGGEPWCFTPPEIARLTDYQIHHVYVLPAVARNKAIGGTMQPTTNTAQPTFDSATPRPVQNVREIAPDKESVVAFYVKEMGLCEATARAMADDQWGK